MLDSTVAIELLEYAHRSVVLILALWRNTLFFSPSKHYFLGYHSFPIANYSLSPCLAVCIFPYSDITPELLPNAHSVLSPHGSSGPVKTFQQKIRRALFNRMETSPSCFRVGGAQGDRSIVSGNNDCL